MKITAFHTAVQSPVLLSDLTQRAARSLKHTLRAFRDANAPLFDALFLEEKVVDGMAFDLQPFADFGLVRPVHDGFQACVRVFPYRDKFLVTDFVSLKDLDRVFPCDEAGPGYLADNLNVRDGDIALDLGTGCGFLALFCADKAKKVFATDVNPKALRYAKFNVQLNSVQDKIELFHGDLFGPVGKAKFDFIVSNPPPVPVPPGTPFFIHSDGGPDGLRVFDRILKQIPLHSRQDCVRHQFVMLSMGSDEHSLVADALQANLKDLSVAVSLVPLYQEPIPLDPCFFDVFNTVPERKDWSRDIRASGLVWLDCFFVDVRSSNQERFLLARKQGVGAFGRGDWARRMAKYVVTPSPHPER